MKQVTWHLRDTSPQTDVPPVWLADADYGPVEVFIYAKTPGGGQLRVDINDDGVSLFESSATQPYLDRGHTSRIHRTFSSTARIDEGSIVTLDVEDPSDAGWPHDVTVILVLEET